MSTPAVNLLPPERRGTPRRVRRFTGGALAAILALALLLGYDTYLLRQTRAVRQETAALAKQAVAQQTAANELRRMREQGLQLQAVQARYQALHGPQWNGLWQAVSNALPPGVTVQSLSASNGAMAVSGTVPSLPLLAEAEERLAAVPGVTGVSLNHLVGGSAGFAFDLRLTLSNPSGAAAAPGAAALTTPGGQERRITP